VLTLFTTPKPFRGIFGTIQRNALRSWTLLRPECDVVLFGDEEGASEVAAELHIRHVPSIARNGSGMPLVRALFERASEIATTPLLCYANADIIFMNDLPVAAGRVASLCDRFLMIGQRHGMDVPDALSFTPGWDARLREQAIQAGLTQYAGIDYFVFPATLWSEIPDDLVVGRAGWDNWPLYEAQLQKALVIDATTAVTAIHQNHDYSHHPAGMTGVHRGAEVDRNRQFLGGPQNVLTVFDATHRLSEEGLRPCCRTCHPMCVCKPATF
jgi:hypothetical protein